jgi:SAM-dependent methyltransferase
VDRVVGIDFSEAAIEYARDRTRSQGSGIEYRCENYLDLDYEGRFDLVNGKNIEEKLMKPSWDVCSKGFWKAEPYIALNVGYHYPEDRVLLSQHIVIDGQDHVDSYLFWSTYYEYGDIEPILARAGFGAIRAFEYVLPGDDAWNGDNVTFYLARKGRGGRGLVE